MTDAIAAVMPAANSAFSIEPITVDAPQRGEVLIDIKAVGVCHTDLVMVSGAFGTAFRPYSGMKAPASWPRSARA